MSNPNVHTYVPGQIVEEQACFQIQYGPRTYRVGNYGHVGFISGEGGAKKSTYAKSICAAALSGKMVVFNKASIGDRIVLYFDTEMPRDLFTSHIEKMFVAANMSPHEGADRLIALSLVQEPDPSEKRKIVLEWIRKTQNLGIVVIDVIADLFVDENDTETAQEFVGEIAAMAQEKDFLALIVSHVSDHGKLLGSIGRKIGRKASFGMKLEEVNSTVSSVIPGKTRYERYPSFDFSLDRDGIPQPGEYIPFPLERRPNNS